MIDPIVSAWILTQTSLDVVASTTNTVPFGFWSAVLHAGPIEKAVMALLAVFSVSSWAIIAYKFMSLRKASHESERFIDLFWDTKRLDAAYQKSSNFTQSPVAQVFRAGYIELSKIRKKADPESASQDAQLGDLESIERAMRRASSIEMTRLESLVSFLATTGSTAPFIGLFGTVIGIIGSFQDIGMAGNASLATVAPGIGGALVATAFGLLAAIPAVIGYNALLSRIRVLDTDMQAFSSDFLNVVKRHFL